MKYFKYGQTHCTNHFYDIIPENDYCDAFRKFESKFWGLVSKEQWEQNNHNAMVDFGELLATYEISSGELLHFFTNEERTYTFVCTAKDLSNGEKDNFFQKLKQIREENSRRRF